MFLSQSAFNYYVVIGLSLLHFWIAALLRPVPWISFLRIVKKYIKYIVIHQLFNYLIILFKLHKRYYFAFCYLELYFF